MFGIDHKDYNEIVKSLDDLFKRMLEAEDYSKYELVDYSDDGNNHFWLSKSRK